MNPVSSNESALLAQYDLTPKQVAEKIVGVIEKVDESNPEANEPLKEKLELSVDEKIEVSISEWRARGEVPCRFCEHVTPLPRNFTIKNTHTKACIKFDDHSLHQLKKHHYFGVENYRIDPVLASKILEMTKPTNPDTKKKKENG